MIKNIFYSFILLISIQNFLFAHSVVLNIIDNEDGTMEVFGGFSTGQSAQGAKLIIKSELNSKILYENRIPNSGLLTMKIPKEPYKVILDSGPGHILEKSGNIEPKNGFNKSIKKEVKNIAYITTFSITSFFIILSIVLALKKQSYLRRV